MELGMSFDRVLEIVWSRRTMTLMINLSYDLLSMPVPLHNNGKVPPSQQLKQTTLRRLRPVLMISTFLQFINQEDDAFQTTTVTSKSIRRTRVPGMAQASSKINGSDVLDKHLISTKHIVFSRKSIPVGLLLL